MLENITQGTVRPNDNEYKPFHSREETRLDRSGMDGMGWSEARRGEARRGRCRGERQGCNGPKLRSVIFLCTAS